MNFLSALILSLAVLAFPSSAMAQGFPAKPIRVVVPYAAGSGTDVAVRIVASRMAQTLGQQVVVDNRAGASGNLGMEIGAKAQADGYTLVVGAAGTLAMNPALFQTLPFNPEKDFEPIILIAKMPMVVVTAPEAPMNNIADLAARARTKAGGLNTGLPSTSAVLVSELLKQNGVALFGINYKSSGAALTDLAGGRLDIAIDTIVAAAPLIRGGKLKALAVSTNARSGLLPEVPTVAEQGFTGFELSAWIGFYAPKGTPPAVVDALNAAARKSIDDTEVRAQLLRAGFQAAGGSTRELADFERAEREKWGRVIKAAGMKAE